MEVNLDIVIDSPDNTVDMKSGLDTMQGASDATRCITETILSEKVPLRLNHRSDVRTTLKQTFRGSYGHVFSINIQNQIYQRRLRSIGTNTLIELIAFFLNESIYNDFSNLSARAAKVIIDLGDVAEQLVEHLRDSAIRNVHDVPTKFGHDVKIRFRKNRDEQRILATFNEETAEVLSAVESEEEVRLEVGITRFNINTGNGRLQFRGANETVAFGFAIEYKTMRLALKKRFSENLDHNNGLDDEHWNYLSLGATPIKLRSGKIVKYIVKRFLV